MPPYTAAGSAPLDIRAFRADGAILESIDDMVAQ
jgi:hypothetical protein